MGSESTEQGYTMDLNDGFGARRHVVGQIGVGYIGKAVINLFENGSGRCFDVVSYDKATDPDSRFDEVVSTAEVIFIAVPTPMESDGRCHTGIVQGVLERLYTQTLRPVDEFVVVVKSTVPPGSTDAWRRLFPGLRLVFSPEFLTERNSLNDFMDARRLLLGGRMEDCELVARFFAEAWRFRIDAMLEAQAAGMPDDGPVLVFCDSTVAELVKYFTNTYLATVVTFANEFRLICDALGAPYESVRELALLDDRISPSHLQVPGPDGSWGFGGSCFPKDVNSIRHVARSLGIPERLFSTVVLRNEELRPSKDWESLKGRAVV